MIYSETVEWLSLSSNIYAKECQSREGWSESDLLHSSILPIVTENLHLFVCWAIGAYHIYMNDIWDPSYGSCSFRITTTIGWCTKKCMHERFLVCFFQSFSSWMSPCCINCTQSYVERFLTCASFMCVMLMSTWFICASLLIDYTT